MGPYRTCSGSRHSWASSGIQIIRSSALHWTQFATSHTNTILSAIKTPPGAHHSHSTQALYRLTHEPRDTGLHALVKAYIPHCQLSSLDADDFEGAGSAQQAYSSGLSTEGNPGLPHQSAGLPSV